MVSRLSDRVLQDGRGGIGFAALGQGFTGREGGYWFRGSRTGFYRPETVYHEKIVLKIKSVVMRAAKNLFRKVHNYTHLKG